MSWHGSPGGYGSSTDCRHQAPHNRTFTTDASPHRSKTIHLEILFLQSLLQPLGVAGEPLWPIKGESFASALFVALRVDYTK